MHKIITTIIATAIALLVVGCGSGSGDEPTGSRGESVSNALSRTEAPEPVEDETLSRDVIGDLFIALIRDSYPTMFLGVDDSEVIDLAEQMCEFIDGGATFADVVMTGLDVGYSGAEIGGFIGAGVAAYCPENSGIVPD